MVLLDGLRLLTLTVLAFVQVTVMRTESGRITMGLMDRVKAQATVLAEKAQETARDSKAKFDQVQAKRHGDVLLRNLGAAVYAERTGRGTPSSQADIDRLIADIKAHEAENGISLAPESGDQPPAGGVPPQGGGVPPQGGSTGFPPEAGPTTQV
jgi:hypothetical protein